MMVEVDFNLILGMTLGLFISLVSVYVYTEVYGIMLDPMLGCKSFSRVINFAIYLVRKLFLRKKFSHRAS